MAQRPIPNVGRRLVESRLLVLELGTVDTRVRDVSTFLDGVFLSNTGGVLEEDDTLVVLDELKISGCIRAVWSEMTHDTVPVSFVERDKHVLLGPLVVGTKEVLQCLRSLPGVVVRDLGRGVVGDVGLANTV